MATERGRASSGIGGSLILIIFIVLTVTVFSVLTLVSAQNELGTINRSAENTKNYYNAEKLAAEKCGELKSALSGLTENSDIVAAAVSSGASASTGENGVTISFSIDIDEKRSLDTTLLAAQGELKITASKIVSKDDGIIIDDSIELWEF